MKRVAAAAGGRWPAVADDLIERDIAEAEMDKEDGLMNVPPAVVILRDVHAVWPGESAFIPTTELADLLIAYNPQMWSRDSGYGKDLTVQRLGRMLVTAFKIHSTRQGDSKRGYYRRSFDVAFRRMRVTPSQRTDGTDVTAEPTVTSNTPSNICPVHGTPTHQGICGRCKAGVQK